MEIFLENFDFDVEGSFDVFEHNLVAGRLLRRTSRVADRKKVLEVKIIIFGSND